MGPTTILTKVQIPSIMQANPQARGRRPTLSDPRMREISPGSDTKTRDNNTTSPAIKE